ncbi:ABC transporter substrate-binding protein [Streptomyces sp. NPDC055092]
MPGPLTGNDPGTTAGAPPRSWREALPGTSRRGFLAAVGAGSLAALLAACAPGDTKSGGSKPNGPPKKGGTLRVGTPPPPTSVDPVTAYDGSAVAIIQLVADYLVWLDKDFGLQPRLATKWTSDKDAKKWTFTLREGVTFSDGTPLDAETVKASFDRLLDPKNKSAALSAFGDILAEGGVAATDSSTVVFTLKRPYVDFPYLVSAGNYNTVILKKDYKGDFTKPHSAIGTGPFVLTSYDASKGASFGRNKRYWNKGKPYLDGVEVTFYRDEQADVAALQSGDIDTQFLSKAQLVTPLSGSGDVVVDEVKSTTSPCSPSVRTRRPSTRRRCGRRSRTRWTGPR